MLSDHQAAADGGQLPANRAIVNFGANIDHDTTQKAGIHVVIGANHLACKLGYLLNQRALLLGAEGLRRFDVRSSETEPFIDHRSELHGDVREGVQPAVISEDEEEIANGSSEPFGFSEAGNDGALPRQ